MDQLITIELDYESIEKAKNLDLEVFNSIRERLPEMGLQETQDQILSYHTYKFVGTILDVKFLSDLGLKVKISRVRGLFDELLPKLGAPQPQGLQVVNITIPSAGLFAVKKLQVLENECTEYVDGWLAKGWRIVAVCPPNDTRRPTYILGSMEERDHV